MITRPITRPITSPIARAVTAHSAIWNPRALFALGEQGVLYDPNDLSTLFQDSAGTVPVTAAGQPVGLMLDKRLGLVRGPEKWNDSAATFFGQSSRVSAGVYRIYSPDGSTSQVSIGGMVAGRFYEVSLTVDYVTAGGVTTELASSPAWTTAGAKKFISYSIGTGFNFKRVGVTDAQISNISIRELPGNHASQPTAASRPMLRDSPRRIDYDGVDDSLVITFPASLGSACTVARSIPGVGAQILTAQTIGTSFTDNADNCGLIIINRALNPTETANLTRYLNQRAGV